MEADGNVAGVHVAAADDEHRVDFRLLGFLNLAVDLVRREIRLAADETGAQLVHDGLGVIHQRLLLADGHRAPLGTHERFIGFLIEHYAGNFPLWLAPEQVRVMTIGEEEPLVNYAKAIVSELRGNFVRCESDFTSNKINGKIQEAEQAKVHTMLVIGGRDMDAGNVSVRLHGKGNVGAKPKGEVVADILAAIKERRA